jgi:hypothetical protein
MDCYARKPLYLVVTPIRKQGCVCVWVLCNFRRDMAQAVNRRPLTASVHVGFVVDEIALRQGFLQALQVFLVSIIPLWLSLLIHHLWGI